MADFKRDIEPGFGAMPEAGWALANWAHGKGFAREALGAVLSYADVSGIGPRTVCIIEPSNIASIRLAERFGFREAGEASLKGNQVMTYQRVTSSA